MLPLEALRQANTAISQFLEMNLETQSLVALRQIEELIAAVTAVDGTIPNDNNVPAGTLSLYRDNLQQLAYVLDSARLRLAEQRQDLAQQLSHLGKANAWISRTKLIATDCDEK